MGIVCKGTLRARCVMMKVAAHESLSSDVDANLFELT